MQQWIEIPFGKHRGKTLPQLIFADPDYFFWAMEDGAFKKALAIQADEIYRCARNIRIPLGKDGRPRHAEYLIHAPTGKFGAMQLIPEAREPHQGGSPVAVRLDRIDLSVPRQIRGYDKQGCKLLMDSLRVHLFGNRNYRYTKQRAEAFFSDSANFVL